MKYILAILILFFSIINQSFSYELKVSGSYKYGTWGLKEDDRIEAEYDLKKDAIKKYANEKFKGNKSGYRDFKKVEDLIIQNIDDFVNIVAFLVDDNDKKNKTLKLTAKIEINEMELDFLISDSSAIGNAMPSEESDIAIVTIAAKLQKLKSFDDKVTEVSKSKDETYSAESNQVDDTGVEISTINESESISQSGGNTEIKLSNIEYGPIQGLDEELFARAAQIFNDNMFNPIDASQFLDTTKIMNEYLSGESLSRDTKNDIYKTIIDYEIPYLIISKLKVDGMSTDPATGKKEASLRVISEVFKCEKFCKSIATVGPVRANQIGSSENEAITNSLYFAVESATEQSVNMMNAKGIR
jgi:hypothetical protein